jgi:hypothetical protein
MTTIAGALLLLFSITMLTYPKWIGHVQPVLNAYDSVRLLVSKLVQDAGYEAMLFNRVLKAHFSIRPGKTGMTYGK